MGGKFKQTKGFKKKGGPSSRKEIRKQLRKEKKVKKNEHFRNKKNLKMTLLKTGDSILNKENSNKDIHKNTTNVLIKKPPNKETNIAKVIAKSQSTFLEEQNKLHKEEMREKAKLDRGIIKQRKKVLLEANKEEDRAIKKLEKQLKLNKRKSKTVPKSFVDDGLDYLLDVCDSEKLKEVGEVEMNLQDSGSEFEDDFALVTGKRKPEHEDKLSRKKRIPGANTVKEELSDDDDSSSGCELENSSANGGDSLVSEDDAMNELLEEDEIIDSESDGSNKSMVGNESEGSENDVESECDEKDIEDEEGSDNFDEASSVGEASDSENDENNSNKNKKQKGEMWEDIYGRLRDKQGNVIQTEGTGKYVPPHIRAQQMAQDAKKSEERARLWKQLKGLINRLAESNMHSIAKQIDELCMRNSRNDMNDSLLSLITEVLVGRVLTAERLVMEHTMLIALLHANVGMEVGAHFLQCFVQKFHAMYKEGQDVENKELDNIVLIISHLYNFKVFHSVLMYNILDLLAEQFMEKEVELILLVLRSVGFSLRKDDPLALKELVLRLQKKASESTHLRDNPRVRFMLDVLMAVKNNNITKIPQYDPSLSEHLRRQLKTLVHKGKYVTELKVTLEDLLKADERGRWWIVGSAWSGAPSITAPSSQTPAGADSSQFSEAVLEMARKQRMNTDTRRNIFCIIVTAEDYLDAFEKLLRLGLKAQQEQEIIHVMMHCMLREKNYNPYYAYLATHFCQANRQHQMTIRYYLWDKLKQLSNLAPSRIANLAKFLAHLFLEKALPISVLKVMQFSEMDKAGVRLLRQVLLSVLLSKSVEEMVSVFSRVSQPEKLHMFRQSLRLFLHHFVLRNTSDLPSDQAQLVKERVTLAETALICVDNKKFL